MKSEAPIVFISPGNNRVIYQDLSQDISAIEPPIWAAMLANFVRTKGYGTAIIDQEAEGLTPEQIVAKALELKPRIAAIVVYGQQPSASTQNMTMSQAIASAFKKAAPNVKTILIGGHVSALPQQSLSEGEADFVCQGEGPHTLEALLQLPDLNNSADYAKVPGLWYRQNGGAVYTQSAPLIPEKDLPAVLPGMAWDMLPMKAYRAHNWHCFSHIDERKPYASLYTSLGCPFHCSFCCINAPFERSSLRCWSPDFVIGQLDILATKYNVKNIKIADEMFVLSPNHVLRLCDLIIERGYKFNFWAYARVDTVKDRFLEKLQKAGFNWLCLGIESASTYVRDGVDKGQFKEGDIHKVVKKIQDAGINVLGNYIFGMPDDTFESMQNTLDMAIELNCEMANFYSGMAYPGSQLYKLAIQKGWELPEKWHDFSQHSFEQLPLRTEHLTAGQVLAFRDRAWQVYFTHPKYLNRVREKFGQKVVDHLQKVAQIKLKRRYAEPLPAEFASVL